METEGKKMKLEEVDRISALPEPLLHHIMSYLPFEQVVQISIVSKTWLRAWHTIPELQFDVRFGNRLRSLSKALQLFNFVEQTLRNRHQEMIILNKFILRMSVFGMDQEYASYIDRCLFYAIESGVEKLKLKCIWEPNWAKEFYDLPQLVLCSKSITVLKVCFCKLVSPTQVMILPRLRKLRLSHVYMDDDMIKNVVACCLMIEYLSLQFCVGFNNVELFGLKKLHKVKLSHFKGLETMKIEGTNVQSVKIYASVELLSISCMNLKCLGLHMNSVTDKWLDFNISNFRKLEHLEIGGADLRSIKISSHCLKRLEINCDNLVDLKIKTPCLSKFDYRGPLVSFSVDASNVLESHLIVSEYLYEKDTEWYNRLVEVLAKFNQFSMVLKLGITYPEDLNIPSELRQILPPPLFGTKHVSLLIEDTSRVKHLVGRIVDFMLWIAPHAETVSIILGRYEEYVIRFKFHYLEELICEGESSHCWRSIPISCWWDCMKKVEIEIINGKLSTGTIVERFSFKGEGIREFKEKYY